MNRRLKLFLAPFACHQGTETLLKRALASGVDPETILYLTPSPRKLREAQVLFSRLVNKNAFIPPRFLTLRQLARELHNRFGTERRLPGELKTPLVQLLLPDTTIGYAATVVNFITDIKRHIPDEEQKLLSDQLTNLLAGFELPLKKALLAYKTFLSYQKELATRGWVDDEDIIARAPDYLKRDFIPPRILILDSFVAPNRLEQKLLAALIGTGETVLALGYGGEENDKNYTIARRWLEFLRSQGEWETEVLPATDAITSAAWQLFRFPTIEEEVIGVCRHIRHSLDTIPDEEKPRFLTGTVIAMPRLDTHLPFLRRFLRQYGIPFTVYPETHLSASPPIVAVLELLTAIATDYERVALTAALSSPFFPKLLRLPDDQNQTQRDIAARALNSLSCRAGIIKGKENWQKIAERIILAEHINEEDPQRELLQEYEKRVNQALGLIEKFLPNSSSIASWARGLKQFLEAADFGKNLTPDDTHQELLKDRQELYDIIDTLADFAEEFNLSPSLHYKATDFLKLLSYLLTTSVRTPESDQDGLTVISIEETLGISPEHLYLIGLTETNLPGAYRSDPILPDRVRRQLEMPDMDWHRDWQRFHLYRTIHSSRNLPFLSFYESQDNQPILPTPLLELEAVPPRVINVIYSEAEHQRLNGETTGSRLDELKASVDFQNDQEVLRELARHFGAEKPLSITKLESYLHCPYLFYIKSVLQLETPEEPTFDMERQQWGLIVHAVLGRLYQNGPVSPDDIKTLAPKNLETILEEFKLPHFWNEVTRQVFNTLLPQFITTENKLRQEGYQPFRTEEKLEGSIGSDIILKGRVDRIDIADGKRLRLVDYKTGKENIGPPNVEDGTHIQLPLYAYLVKEKLTDKTIDNIGIYNLTDLKVNWLAKKQDVSALIQTAIEKTIEIVQNIRAGKFPAKPSKKAGACYSCPLKFTCGFTDTDRESSPEKQENT